MPLYKRPFSPGQFDTVILSPGSFGTKDHLQANGSIKTDIIFYPFGQVWAYDNWDELQFFGGMENWDWTNGLGYTPNRTYRANHGRWLSPDPLAGDISNPQSLNRYAYVLNNPATLTDPTGLGFCPMADTTTERGCPNGGGNDFGAYTLDGMIVSNSIGQAVLAGGFGVQCPNNLCSGLGTDPYSGNQAYLFFTAGAGGATGYLSMYDWSQGVNEVNGTFLSNAQYDAYLQATYASQISAQCATLSGNLSADATLGSGASVNCGNLQYIQGGHANFAVTCGSWGTYDTTSNAYNCAGRWPGGLHIEGDPTDGFWGHNDTASYYIGQSFNWGTFSPWNLLVHGTVDFIGGSLFTYVFAH
jgi:RHS repeat-associated protein